MLAVILWLVWQTFGWSITALWVYALWWTRDSLKAFQIVEPGETGVAVNAANSAPLPAQKPKISVLLPARNEEKRVLKECVESLLAQEYENFEIIAVDDCSSDRTHEILRGFAVQNPKLHVLIGRELPAGWLGKPFVLEQALAKASGEWILTTDADVIFKSPRALDAAIKHAGENRLDALCLIPFVICQSFWEIIFMPIFEWFRLLAMPPRRVNNLARREAMGIGNFFLVRRDWLEQIDGFAPVRQDVAEDLSLAEFLKASGARIRTDLAPALIQTRMYSSLSEIWHGFTKNFFAGSKFSIPNALLGVVAIVLFGVLPSLGAAVNALAWLATGANIYLFSWLPLALVYALQILLFGYLNFRMKLPLGHVLAAPLGLGLFAAILLNSAFKIVSGRGVVWKERAIYNHQKNQSSGARSQ